MVVWFDCRLLVSLGFTWFWFDLVFMDVCSGLNFLVGLFYGLLTCRGGWFVRILAWVGYFVVGFVCIVVEFENLVVALSLDVICLVILIVGFRGWFWGEWVYFDWFVGILIAVLGFAMLLWEFWWVWIWCCFAFTCGVLLICGWELAECVFVDFACLFDCWYCFDLRACLWVLGLVVLVAWFSFCFL